MELLYADLYESVLIPSATNSNELHIISGYASAAFLEKVMQEFPDLEIKLFIGMTVFGIDRKNHEKFQKLVRDNSRISVYYQISGKPTHIKLYTWKVHDKFTSHIGSANFTENGFIHFNEILVASKEDTSPLFVTQSELSVICTLTEIEAHIKIYEDKNDIPDALKESNFVISNNNNVPSHQIKRDFFEKISQYQWNSIEIPIVLETDPRWKTRGINNHQLPTLIQPPKISPKENFSGFFPQNETIIFETDDNKVLHGHLQRKNHNHLIFEENIKEYLCGRMGIIKKRAISFDDLLKYGRTTISIFKVNENNYLFDFSVTKKLND